MNAANVVRHKIFRGKPSFVDKKMDDKRRGRANQRQLTPQGVKYYELNRSQPGSLPATKNHQGGLADAKDESDAKIFSVPGSERCPVKTVSRTTWTTSTQRQIFCFRDQEMVKARSSIPQTTKNYTRQHDERDVKAGRYRATSNKPLPQSNALRLQL